MDANDRVLEYEGRFYARPVNRGICLEDLGENSNNQLEDLVYDMLGSEYSRKGQASGRLRLRIEILEIDD